MLQQAARTVTVVTVAAVGAATLTAPVPRATPAVSAVTRLAAAATTLDVDTPQVPVDLLAGTLPLADVPAVAALGDGIIGIYLTLEDWVSYGVSLLTWALRWLPFGGLLAAQLNMFYELGESVVRSLVFNTAYLLDGTVDLGEALSNIAGATSAAVSTFIDNEISWFQHLLPPLPPLAAVAALPLGSEAFLDGVLPEPPTAIDPLPDLPALLSGLTG